VFTAVLLDQLHQGGGGEAILFMRFPNFTTGHKLTNIHILPLATNISQPEVSRFSLVAFLKPQLQSEESILHSLNVKFQKTQ